MNIPSVFFLHCLWGSRFIACVLYVFAWGATYSPQSSLLRSREVMVVLSTAFVAPLCCLEKIDALSATSGAAIACVMCIAILVSVRASRSPKWCPLQQQRAMVCRLATLQPLDNMRLPCGGETARVSATGGGLCPGRVRPVLRGPRRRRR